MLKFKTEDETTKPAHKAGQKAKPRPPKAERNHELLTVREVAKALRVDGTSVRRWIKAGALEASILPHKNKRTSYRIRRDTLNKILG